MRFSKGLNMLALWSACSDNNKQFIINANKPFGISSMKLLLQYIPPGWLCDRRNVFFLNEIRKPLWGTEAESSHKSALWFYLCLRGQWPEWAMVIFLCWVNEWGVAQLLFVVKTWNLELCVGWWLYGNFVCVFLTNCSKMTFMSQTPFVCVEHLQKDAGGTNHSLLLVSQYPTGCDNVWVTEEANECKQCRIENILSSCGRLNLGVAKLTHTHKTSKNRLAKR